MTHSCISVPIRAMSSLRVPLTDGDSGLLTFLPFLLVICLIFGTRVLLTLLLAKVFSVTF